MDTLVGAEFIEFLRKRLIFLRELLADDGSIYVHLDWKKAHYIKAVMDEVFGEENFLNDIIWHYGGRGAKAVSRQFSRNHDIILLYRKKDHLFNRTFVDKRVQKKGHGFRQDELGRWFKTAPRGDYTDRSIRELEKAGRVYRTRNGNVRIKYFVREEKGGLIEQKLVGDVWDDIPDAMHLPASERTGYPTQKPEKLLSRIISASTMEGDIVLDAFSGAGTTLVAAEKLGRRWIGIDSGKLAIETAIERIQNIAVSKDLENPGKRYPTPPRHFVLYRAMGASQIKRG
jgi:adenine specific DNA methylase Mod